MENGVFLQIQREVQHRQPDLFQPYPAGNGNVGNKKRQDQTGTQDQDRIADPVGPFKAPCIGSKHILVFLPPHGSPSSVDFYN